MDEYDALSAASCFNPALLQGYYGRLFPAQLMFQWLARAQPTLFQKREWSYTLDNDIYVRFQAFKDHKEFKDDLKKKVPHKIDIGAIYNARPSMKSAVGSFIPLQREFVIDIDLTDYGDVRACCEGANACDKCWTLMKAAMKVLHAALVEDLGFEHILWVYSGRRGIHCWVCDERIVKFDNEQRSKLIDYFSVYQGNEHNAQKISNDALTHPSVKRAYDILKPIFENEWIHDQEIFTRPEGAQQVLGLIQIQGML
jgi:DNA primase small subunit